MSKKVIVSACPVIGFAILSIAASLSIPEQRIAVAVDHSRVIDLITAEEAECVPETTFVSVPVIESDKPSMPDKVIRDTYYSGMIELSWDEAYLLTQIAMEEAEGEDTEGKALVMWVVLNRIKSEEFPNSVEEVIYDEGEFAPVGNEEFGQTEPNDDCWRALNMIVIEGWNQSEGALYFESEKTSSWHSEHLEFLFKHGNHNFYK